MLRPLIAPSTSPISRAFEVPIACPQVPQATPRATGSAILKSRQRIRAKVLQKIPATLTIIIVRAASPPFCSVIAIAIGVVIDFGRRETYSSCPILKISQTPRTKKALEIIPLTIPSTIASAFSRSFWNWR